MRFCFRRSARRARCASTTASRAYGYSKGGLSPISVGVPGTGLTWSMEHTPERPAALPAGPAVGRPNSRRLRPGQLDALKQSLEVLHRELVSAGPTGEQL